MKYLALLILVFASFSLAQTPTTTATPRGVVEKMLNDALAVLRDPSLTREQKQKKVREIADVDIDFETLARLSMGRFWRDLSETQRADFVKEFTEHVSATHGHIIDEYVDEESEINGDRQEDRGDWTVQT